METLTTYSDDQNWLISDRPFGAFPLTRKLQAELSIFVSGVLITASFLGFLWATVAGIILTSIVFILLRKEYYALLLFIIVNALVAIKPGSEEDKSSIYEIVTIFLGSLVFVQCAIKIVFFNGEKRTYQYPERLLMIYLLWGSILGLIGMVLWEIQFDKIIHEFSVQSQFIFIPILMVRNININTDREKQFKWTVIILWLILLGANVLQIRSNIAKAFYLYETGRASIDISIHSLMLFVFVSLSFCKGLKQRYGLMTMGALLSILGIIISFYRTIWLSDILALAVIFLLTRKGDRKGGVKFIAILSFILISIGVIAYFSSPLFSLMIKNYAERFINAPKATTSDPSLINRYYESEAVLRAVKNSPIVGYGFGEKYWSYGYLLGFTKWYVYCHNGYLYLLLKSGLIGFALFAAAYIGIIMKGVRLARSSILDQYHKALVRAGLAFLISLLLVNLTINSLSERDALLWGGVVWGYFLICEKSLLQKKAFLP